MGRIAIVVMLLLAMIGTANRPAAQEWVEHRPAGGGYRIAFPQPPALATHAIQFPGELARMVVASTGDLHPAYTAAHMIYPAGILSDDPQQTLDQMRDGAIARVKGSLREEQRIMLGNAPARRFIADIAADRLVYVSVIVRDGLALYTAHYTGPQGSESGPDVGRFFASFQLIPR